MADFSPAQLAPPRKRADPSGAEALMAMMNKSIDVSRLQFKRIRRDLDEFHQLAGSEASVRVFDGTASDDKMSKSKEIRTALFADVHFLLISMHETEQLFTKFKKLYPLESDLSNLHNRHRPMLRYCTEFRTHMEHVDGTASEDFGKLKETVYSLRGKTIDLGPAFEQEAEALFADLVAAWTRISERQRRIRELIVRGQPAV